MLFVDLLTRPGHQGEALREPRLRNQLWISKILLLRQHGPDASCHPVGQLDRDQHFRFALQHLRQPTALANTKPCRRRDHRHRPGDQQTSKIFLAHLRDPAESILATRRVLHWHETEPGREVPPSLEATHIWSKSLDRQRLALSSILGLIHFVQTLSASYGHGLLSHDIFFEIQNYLNKMNKPFNLCTLPDAFACYGFELICQIANLGCERFNVLDVKLRGIAYDV